MTKIELKINATVKEVIGLYDSGLFSLKKSEELLNQFKKEDLINELLYTDEENVHEGDYEDEEIIEAKVRETPKKTKKEVNQDDDLDDDLGDDLEDDDLDDL